MNPILNNQENAVEQLYDFKINSNFHTEKVKKWKSQQAPIQDLTVKDRELFSKYGFGSQVKPLFSTISNGIAHYIKTQGYATAVECGNKKITYKELDKASNRLANQLLNAGVKRGDAVCLYLYRSIPMVVGILAAMKIGAAYVPQHVGVAPIKSMRYIAKTTQAKVIMTLSNLMDKIPVEKDQTVLKIDEIMKDSTLDSDLSLPKSLRARPKNTCMILFTSGTTGVPNGVQVTHQNLANILLTAPGNLGIRPGIRVGQILSIAFDMAAWETLGCLANGGTLVIRGKSIQETAEKVDVLIATPSILNSLDASSCQQIKTVAVAGEPCPRPLADLWSGFCRFYNSCGPTETTIINTAEPHYPDKSFLSIGRPTPNNTVYILDEDLNPLPIGEKGEMWAGGDCVTKGYLANDELNAERYRPDPFLGGDHIMFKTRDLGRWTETGELEHWGRVDDMVKIRGFRVELDGVTNILECIDNCEQAVTLKYDNKTLVSFLTPENTNIEAARKGAEKALPYYAVPEFIIAQETLPRTDRGKIDKRKLLELARTHIEEKNNDHASN
jgi:amino acid adenylation domain-containing protein